MIKNAGFCTVWAMVKVHYKFLSAVFGMVVVVAGVFMTYTHILIANAKIEGDEKARCAYVEMTNRVARAQREFEETAIPLMKRESDECFRRRREEFYIDHTNKLVSLPRRYSELCLAVKSDHALSNLNIGVEYRIENGLGFEAFSVEKNEESGMWFAVLHFANVLKNIRVVLEVFDENYLCNGTILKDVNAQDKRYMKIAGNFLLSVWMAKQELKTKGNGVVATVKRDVYAKGVKHFGEAAGAGVGKEMFGGAEGLTFVDACEFSDSLVKMAEPKYFRVRVEEK